MPRNNSNAQYWNMVARQAVQEAYNVFLLENNYTSSPHHAHIFAMRYLQDSANTSGMNEREMIIFLAGTLPEMYD